MKQPISLRLTFVLLGFSMVLLTQAQTIKLITPDTTYTPTVEQNHPTTTMAPVTTNEQVIALPDPAPTSNAVMTTDNDSSQRTEYQNYPTQSTTTTMTTTSTPSTRRFLSFAEAAQSIRSTSVATPEVLEVEPVDPIATVTTTNLPSDVADLIQTGQNKARQALAVYTQQHIGQPLWQEAVAIGANAIQRAPSSPEPQYFLAEVYSLTNYWAPAWQSWLNYFALGGEATVEAQRQFANVGVELGYLYYNSAYISEALTIFRKITEHAPNSPRGFIWTARVLYEQELYQDALPYWERASLLAPNNEGVQFYIEETRARLPRVEPQVRLASFNNPIERFQYGIQAFDNGDYASAERLFRDALQENNNNAAAWAYLARSAVAQQKLSLAQQAVGRATFIEPTNEEYRSLEQRINNLYQ